MLGLFLGLMAYDTVKTVNDNIERNQKAQKRDHRILEIERRLTRGVTQNHRHNCICRLCVNRRRSLEAELKELIRLKTQESK